MRILTLMLLVVLLFIPALTCAKGPAGVVNGVHNLSATGVSKSWDGTPVASLYATNTEQVCVFCHTPHGGSLDAPLWNRENPAGFTHYNSAMLSTDLGLSVNRAPGQETLLCLSCHDGSISVNHVTNVPNYTIDGLPLQTWNGEENTEIIDDISSGGPGKRIGGGQALSSGTGDLTDDHPISFSYQDVYDSDTYTLGPRGGTLKPLQDAKDNGVEFFGAGDDFVECSSCHDPHVNYIDALGGNSAYAPFLIMSNSGSALCLACHTK
jgi:hypothetical protein